MNNSVTYLAELMKKYENQTGLVIEFEMYSDGSCRLVRADELMSFNRAKNAEEMISWLELMTSPVGTV